METNSFFEKAKEAAPAVLRIAMALVFLYFGISQLRTPSLFIGYLPKEAALIPISARSLVVINGGFEVFLGSLLLLGLYTRLCALLLGLHLAAITISIGYGDIGVRDFGLSIAMLSLAMNGQTIWSLDSFFKHRREELTE